MVVIGLSEADLTASVNAATKAHAQVIHPGADFVANSGVNVGHDDPIDFVDKLKRSVEAQDPDKGRAN